MNEENGTFWYDSWWCVTVVMCDSGDVWKLVMCESWWCVTVVMSDSWWCVTVGDVWHWWCVTVVMCDSWWCVTVGDVWHWWCVTVGDVWHWWYVTVVMCDSWWCVTGLHTWFMSDGSCKPKTVRNDTTNVCTHRLAMLKQTQAYNLLDAAVFLFERVVKMPFLQ